MVRDRAQDRTGLRGLPRGDRMRPAHHGALGRLDVRHGRRCRLHLPPVRVRGLALPHRDTPAPGDWHEARPGGKRGPTRAGAFGRARVRRRAALSRPRGHRAFRRGLLLRRLGRGAERHRPLGARGGALGRRRAERRREVNDGRACQPILRRDGRHGEDRRRGRARHRLRRPFAQRGRGVPENVSDQRQHPREHPHGVGRFARGGARGRPPCLHRRLRHGPSSGLRHGDGVARQPGVRRPAPAHRHRPRHLEGCAHPHPRRGHERGRSRKPAGDRRRHRQPLGGQDRHRRGPSAGRRADVRPGGRHRGRPAQLRRRARRGAQAMPLLRSGLGRLRSRAQP
ncbi:hypothetical protein BN3658_00724 [Coriobacteriaceae bacterium CHKCI002]|nr:hypothetical protein BN3658_00724 [Coriobacteriaceae bacterium CHKCI002]